VTRTEERTRVRRWPALLVAAELAAASLGASSGGEALADRPATAPDRAPPPTTSPRAPEPEPEPDRPAPDGDTSGVDEHPPIELVPVPPEDQADDDLGGVALPSSGRGPSGPVGLVLFAGTLIVATGSASLRALEREARPPSPG
jgi:hypothetical protein